MIKRLTVPASNNTIFEEAEDIGKTGKENISRRTVGKEFLFLIRREKKNTYGEGEH